MVVEAILNVLKSIFFSIIACLLLPFYPCFIVKYATEKAADERRAEGLMAPIWGLAANVEERKRLSITPSMLEEGPSDGHALHSDNITNGNSSLRANSKKTRARVGILLSKLPYPKAHRVSQFSFSFPLPFPFPFSFSSSPSSTPPSTSPPVFKKQVSQFFTRLPLEIRLAIYHHALSCQRVHVVRVPGKVASFACPEGVKEGFACFEGGNEDYQCLSTSVDRAWVGNGPLSFGNMAHQLQAAPVAFSEGSKRGIVGALDLLSVCRQVYTEAITVLYKNLTFQMDVITLLAFSISIPEHHLKAITKLEISGPQLNYIDSCYYLQYLPSFRRIRQQSQPLSAPSAQQASDDSNPTPPPAPEQYKINKKLSSFTRYRAEDIPVYTPRAPTAWEETCNHLLPRMTGLCELRISLKRPWPFTEKCMSPASERYLLRPLADEQLRRTKLPFLRVFEVRVDWKEGLEEHLWNEKGLWPVPKKPAPLPLPGSETEMQEMQEAQAQAQEPEMEVEDMWRPSAFLLERGSRAELLAREGWEVWREEQWDSYLVKKKMGGEDEDEEEEGEEEEEEKEEEEVGDGGDGNRKRGRLWKDAPFTVVRSFGAEGQEVGL